MMSKERRHDGRVIFQRGFPVHIMAIDGTWRRTCVLEDISNKGARLSLEASVENLNLKEFFLVLSATGLAFRRCELAWVQGRQIGASFLAPEQKKKAGKPGSRKPVSA
jgi:hypothetical protein